MSEIVVTVGDIETTGLKQEDGHRIIEVALSCYAYDVVKHTHRKLGQPYIQRINPGRAIDPGAEAVHKISLADLRGKPDWKTASVTVNSILSKTKLFVAHNAQFDSIWLAQELMRVGFPCPKFQVFCTMEEGRKATGFGKVPNLGELAYAMGLDYDTDKAHGALYDTNLLAECYWRGIAMNLFKRPDEVVS